MEKPLKVNKTPGFLYYLLPSLGVMLWVAAFIGVLTKGSQMVNADGDLALHIAVGEYILENRTVPLTDVFSQAQKQQARQQEHLDDLLQKAKQQAKKDQDERPPSPFDLD